MGVEQKVSFKVIKAKLKIRRKKTEWGCKKKTFAEQRHLLFLAFSARLALCRVQSDECNSLAPQEEWHQRLCLLSSHQYFSPQGTAIGKCPKNKLLKGYIELELQLREFDRCRKLYEKYLEFTPENCTTWIKFAELETILGDIERARAIFELAIGQPRLDMPEVTGNFSHKRCPLVVKVK